MSISIRNILDALSLQNAFFLSGNVYALIEKVSFYIEGGPSYSDRTVYFCRKSEVLSALNSQVKNLICYPDTGGVTMPKSVNCVVLPSEDPRAASNLLSDMFLSNNEIDSNSTALIKSLAAGANLEQIITEGRRLVHNPLKLLNADFDILNPDPEHADEEKLLFNDLKNDKSVVSRLRADSGPVIIEPAEKLRQKYPGAFSCSVWCRILYHGNMIGYLVVEEFLSSVNSVSFRQLQQLSEVFAIAFKLDKYAQHTSGRQIDDLLKNMLSRRNENLGREAVERRMKMLGWIVPPRINTIVILPDELGERKLEHQIAIWELVLQFGGARAIWYDDRIVLIIPAQTLAGKLSWFTAFLRENGLRAGVSQTFEELQLVCDYYRQAMDALRVGKHIAPEQAVFLYDDYSIYYPLEAYASAADVLQLCNPAIRELYRYDIQHNTELTKTLYCYLKTNQNAINTAKALHIHRNTMYYRMEKINEVAGYPLNNSADLPTTLLYSMEILRYIKAL